MPDCTLHFICPGAQSRCRLFAEAHGGGNTRFLHIDASLSEVIGAQDRKQLFLPVRDAFPKASAELQLRLEKAVVSGSDFAEVVPAGPRGVELLVAASSASSASAHSKMSVWAAEQAATSKIARDNSRKQGASLEPAQLLQVVSNLIILLLDNTVPKPMFQTLQRFERPSYRAFRTRSLPRGFCRARNMKHSDVF